MPKKEVVKLCEAFEKSNKFKKHETEENNSFVISFVTNDCQLNTKDGKVSVTAKISKEYFDTIIYSYGIYVIDYLNEKKLI
jgi:predicted Fe-Mo cluster-binding NifX family protein